MMQGTSSDAVILGGNPPYPSQARAIENWDGTSWTTNPVSLVSEGNSQAAGQGSSASKVSAFGGSAGSSLAEQFNKSVNTITAAAWSSGGSLNLGRHELQIQELKLQDCLQVVRFIQTFLKMNQKNMMARVGLKEIIWELLEWHQELERKRLD